MKLVIAGKEIEVADDVLSKAIEDKTDVTIDSDSLVIRSKDEEESYVTNLKNEARTAGVEIAVKEARNTLGLDFTGKTVDNLIEAVKTKTLADAKIEPEAKVAELMKDVDTLKTTISTITAEKEQVQSQFHSFKSESVINNTLSSVIPDNAALPKDDMIILLKSKMKFQVDESNKIVVLGQDGNIMKNPTTLDPLDAKSVVTSFFNDNPTYIKGAGGGAGGDDSGGKGGAMTVEEFIAKKEKEGVSHTSQEFQKELMELQKQGLIK